MTERRQEAEAEVARCFARWTMWNELDQTSHLLRHTDRARGRRLRNLVGGIAGEADAELLRALDDLQAVIEEEGGVLATVVAKT